MNKETNISSESIGEIKGSLELELKRQQLKETRTLYLARAREILANSPEAQAKRLSSWKAACLAKSQEEKDIINRKKSESYKRTLQTKGKRVQSEEEKGLARERKRAAWFAKPRQEMIEIRNKKILATWQAKSQEERDVLTIRRLAIKKANREQKIPVS